MIAGTTKHQLHRANLPEREFGDGLRLVQVVRDVAQPQLAIPHVSCHRSRAASGIRAASGTSRAAPGSPLADLTRKCNGH